MEKSPRRTERQVFSHRNNETEDDNPHLNNTNNHNTNIYHHTISSTTTTTNTTNNNDKMSMLAMVTPTPHAPFRSRGFWDSVSPTDYTPSRPRLDNSDRIALPSIRQAIPELQIRIAPQDGSIRTPVSASASSPVVSGLGARTPEYVHSPNSNKRRRLSVDDEIEERASRVPRLYKSPPRPAAAERPVARPASPALSYASAPRAVGPEQWAPAGPAARTSPRLPLGGLPAIRSHSPIVMEPASELADVRPTLPSFPPPLSLDRAAAPIPRIQSRPADEYLPQQEPSRPVYMQHPPDPRFEAPAPGYRHPQYDYGYHHPSRVQSLSLNAIRPYERAPMSAVGYGPHYGNEYMRFGEMGMGMNGDNKQRKRRGNLPKETTDKLRAWFHQHLMHPYPSEEEKQELIRQTGLQINQISNWFINARRRQWPILKESAEAVASRGADGKVMSRAERGGRHSPTTSEGGESAFIKDDLDARGRFKRGGSF